jgi:hypothetical protein
MLPPFRSLLLLCLAFLLVPLAASQQTPPRPPPAPADQEQIVPYWTTETGWTSELQLRNNRIGQELTVTPVLRTAYGAETALAPVTIKSEEVKSIDLDAAIGTTAPQLVGTYGSLVLRYRSPGSRSLYASLMVRNIGHPFVFHIDATIETQDLQAGSREGIWWVPKDTTSDYLVLTNQGKITLPLDLSLYDANGKESKQQVLLGPHATMRYSVRKLILAAGLNGSYGGIKVSAASHAGSLDTVHFLFDEAAAFSAILKMFDHDPNAKLEQRDFARTSVWTLRAPMLALSNPDPALAFPPGTTLRPQLFIRNSTSKPVDAALRFNWRADSASGKAAGPALRLNPYETRRIDVAALQNSGLLPKQANWTSVTLTTNGLPDEVMAVAASYDDTLRYGAQTPFSDQLSFQWEGGMWEYDAYHSSIITAGNGGTKPARAAFTIFYNQGTEKYELEQTLQPDEQMWIDVGKLIREHVPDKNGKTLSPDITSGSYEIRDLTDIGAVSLFEGKVIFDKTYGHAAYGCANCCDFTNVALDANPLSVAFQGTSQNGMGAYQWCADHYTDVSSYFLYGWKTGNTGITTVNYMGTYSGVGVGSTTDGACGYIPTGQQRNCPAYLLCRSGTADVTPKVVQGNRTHVYIGSDSTVIQNNALFSQGTPSGGTYTWSTPDSTTSFDNVNAQDPHVKATNYTGKTNDTQLTVNYSFNGVAATPASVMVTKLIFERLCCDSVIQVASYNGQMYNGQTTYGYIFQASYNVIANPGSVQVSDASGVSTNEQVTQTGGNTNLVPNIGQGALTTNSQLLDYPLSILSNSPLPANLNIVDSQNLFVGGFYVRNNTLTWTSTGVTVKNNGPTS